MKRVVLGQSSKQSPHKMSGSPGSLDVNSEGKMKERACQDARVKDPKEIKYETRLNASSGFWLCFLLPIAYLANNIRYPKSSIVFEYQMTSVVSFGLCLQSIYMFLCIIHKLNSLLKIVLMLIPGMTVSLLIHFGLNQLAPVCIFWGFGTTLVYNCVYFKLLKALPKSFTFGEASIAAEGLILFLLNGALQIPGFVRDPPLTDMGQMNAIMITALLCLATTLGLLYMFPFMRNAVVFYPLMIALVGAVCTVPVTWSLPVVTLWNFIVADLRRVFIIIFYLGLVGATVATVNWRLGKTEKASTAMRKLFHIFIVFVYVPGLIYQCTFLYIASGVALALITVVETIRVIKVPPLYDVLEKSFNVFADEKDSGKVALTPFYLLIGCSLPLWISPNACITTDYALHNLIPMLAGILTVGIGDTAASAIGSTIGKHKWPRTNKSIEGTIANILAQAFIVCALVICGYVNLDPIARLTTGIAITLSSFTEAFTDQVDNIVLPLIFYITCIIV